MMSITSQKTAKGFTLIELLVVIAIIGILSSVVLASLNTARLKSRDTRRIADIKQLQLALALYFDSNGGYPATLAALAPQYIAAIPADPVSSRAYVYSATGASGCTSGTSYHLGAVLEEASNQALLGDIDAAVSTTVCTGSAAEFDGTGAGAAVSGITQCTSASGTPQGQTTPTELCYDQKP
ncbi:prepilin-type N-terminal cleavage/methylation domain-containing protein [Patescibacteria group bacterium]|nr:prepilin-type N-terminal cleavage/methylation domain-containing protein [Patescibacteria group bacterium]